MSITKKPHFVPAAYLQFWSVDSSFKGRESEIFVTDNNGCKKRKAKNTAVEKWLYTKDSPNEAEEYFQEFENDWAKLVRQFISGDAPKGHILAPMLLLQSSYFLLRNRGFENKTSKERIEIYKSAIEGFWNEVLMQGEIPKTPPECARAMMEKWECHLLPNKTEVFITSDNPTLTLNFKDEFPGIIYLPITPNWALIALRKGIVKLSNDKITEQDVSHLNSYMVINSNREVYSNKEFGEDEIKSFAKWIAERPKRDNWFQDDALHMESFNFPVKLMTLSFLE